MPEHATPTRSELLAEWLDTLSDVSDRLQSILDRFSARERELDRLVVALARIGASRGSDTAGPDAIDDYVAEGRRRAA